MVGCKIRRRSVTSAGAHPGIQLSQVNPDGRVRLRLGSPGPDQRLLFLGHLDLRLIHGALEHSTNSKALIKTRSGVTTSTLPRCGPWWTIAGSWGARESRPSAPEDRVAAGLDVVEQRLDVLGRALALVLVELQVPVAPVDRPLAGGWCSAAGQSGTSCARRHRPRAGAPRRCRRSGRQRRPPPSARATGAPAPGREPTYGCGAGRSPEASRQTSSK
jgi:hypothetical protein